MLSQRFIHGCPSSATTLATPNEPPRSATVERERRKADFIAAAGDGGLLRLRWLECRREVAETAGPWPADVGGRFDPSRSRVWSPGVGVEAEAAAAQRNKSSQALPRPGDASLRHRRRACGGGVPGVEPLYRSCPATTRRPGGEVSVPLFSFVDIEAASDLVEVWGVDSARCFCGGLRRRRSRVWIQSRQSLGCVPGRWTNSDGFISSVTMSVFCGSCQSLMARRLLRFEGGWRPSLVIAGGEFQITKDPGTCFAISMFFRVFSVIGLVVQLSSVSYHSVPVWGVVFVRYL